MGESWIQREMNGYGDEDSLPSYRIIQGTLRANNYVRREWIPVILEDVDFPPYEARQPLTEIVNLASQGDEVSVVLSYEATKSILSHSDFGMETEIRYFMPRNKFSAIKDHVQDTILKWSIELEKNGISGNGMSFTSREVAVAQNINIINIFGNASNVQVKQSNYHS